MKRILKIPFLLPVIFLLFSCEEVVEIDLEESEPRLVIDASIKWIKGTQGNVQFIRLTTTAPYYQDEVPPVTNARVEIKDEQGEIYVFDHTENGIYQIIDFKPVIGMQYQLSVAYNDQLYIATERLVPVVDIDFVEQTSGGGFAGDEIEVKAYYTDPADEENFYFFSFEDERTTFEIYEDQFNNGNQIFGYYSDEDLEPGEEISIEMAGISRAYYEYLFVLRAQIGTNSGGPFETKPATLKGNIVNQTNQENYSLGYFRLSEVDTTNYVIE
ncbi:DUF4249 domain-containing protein [Salegentibacter sp. F188]|uniref:DUF4249 domain-containing protein n=1 Tax=Autumnicola patrickiae TaxID=3075591 RepID=A0ABU3DXZ3_9FLAO|nr:DUF4249 domain-containing protein [Salegentibacter sp. F188]MDT0688319.1 DUF4249 domain-containing protein [Salegentibacter sp. F188]